jgi:hypothetical protein
MMFGDGSYRVTVREVPTESGVLDSGCWVGVLLRRDVDGWVEVFVAGGGIAAVAAALVEHVAVVPESLRVVGELLVWYRWQRMGGPVADPVCG